MVIRRFENADAQQTFEMIAHTLRTVNIKDYSPQLHKVLEDLIVFRK